MQYFLVFVFNIMNTFINKRGKLDTVKQFSSEGRKTLCDIKCMFHLVIG